MLIKRLAHCLGTVLLTDPFVHRFNYTEDIVVYIHFALSTTADTVQVGIYLIKNYDNFKLLLCNTKIKVVRELKVHTQPKSR